VFAYEFNDPNAPPGVNGSGFTTASQHAAELAYIFNFGAPFTDAQKSLAANMKTCWANFVKTRNPNNNGDLVVLASNSGGQLPFWKHFNTEDFQIQSLTPPGLVNPQGPHIITTFSTDHFFSIWEPLLTFNNGNEPQQPCSKLQSAIERAKLSIAKASKALPHGRAFFGGRQADPVKGPEPAELGRILHWQITGLFAIEDRSI
jgi:hypothetical protein